MGKVTASNHRAIVKFFFIGLLFMFNSEDHTFADHVTSREAEMLGLIGQHLTGRPVMADDSCKVSNYAFE
jgi:hypothetical protein